LGFAGVLTRHWPVTVRSLVLALLVVSGAGVASAQDDTGASSMEGRDIEEFSLEDLLNQGITSVSKKDEKLIGAASAVYVVRGDDIRRSGARNLPDALRMVPGIQVARLTANLHSVSSRGFADITANKLLVLIDGRSVYSLLFSGVLWDVQDVLLEDVDRIEVIRGPGGTLWGANAVNGIINVVTKEASATRGALATVGAGTSDRGFAGLRYGARLREGLDLRVFAKAFDWNGHDQIDDDWHQARVGGRADWRPGPSDLITVQGEYYRGDATYVLVQPLLQAPFVEDAEGPAAVWGADVIARWTHNFSPASVLTVQSYWDVSDRSDGSGVGWREQRDTFDLEVQHHFPLLDRHQIMWGTGLRVTRDNMSSSFAISYDPRRTVLLFGSAFLQDEIAFLDQRLHLTLGAKLERNPFTDFEYQPTARVSFVPGERHGLWASLSRSVRMPSRAEQDVRLNRVATPGTRPLLVAVFGRPRFRSEVLLAAEAGYRVQPVEPFTLDVSAFFNAYDHLRSLEPGDPYPESAPAPEHIVVPLNADNQMRGRVLGVEANARWQAFRRARFELSYSYLNMHLTLRPGSGDTTSRRSEGQSPPHQLALRGSLDLPHQIELDATGRFVDELAGLKIAAYAEADLRLGWRPTPAWELSLVGQNLLHHKHREYEGSTLLTTRTINVFRAAYASVTFRH
jgi:iron complex outermembrane receptor protein